MERTLLTEADRGAILAGLRSLESGSGTGPPVPPFPAPAVKIPAGPPEHQPDGLHHPQAVAGGGAVGEAHRGAPEAGALQSFQPWGQQGAVLDLEVLKETFPLRPFPSPITPVQRVYPESLQAVIRFDPAARWRIVDEWRSASHRETPGTGRSGRGPCPHSSFLRDRSRPRRVWRCSCSPCSPRSP